MYVNTRPLLIRRIRLIAGVILSAHLAFLPQLSFAESVCRAVSGRGSVTDTVNFQGTGTVNVDGTDRTATITLAKEAVGEPAHLEGSMRLELSDGSTISGSGNCYVIEEQRPEGAMTETRCVINVSDAGGTGEFVGMLGPLHFETELNAAGEPYWVVSGRLCK